MRKLPLLPERPFLGPLKTLDSARTSFGVNRHGQLVLTIQHEAIRGVTPEMLRWWFETLGQTVKLDGRDYPRYLLWHPRDHIHWELARKAPNGGTGQGAYFRIVEAFGANPAYYVDSTEYVEKLDEGGLSLARTIAGVEIFRLEHRFTRVQNGTQYDSRMVVGASTPMVGRIFNNFIRPLFLSNEGARAWLRHNIEEVGMFEHLLPPLYAQRGQSAELSLQPSDSSVQA